MTHRSRSHGHGSSMPRQIVERSDRWPVARPVTADAATATQGRNSRFPRAKPRSGGGGGGRWRCRAPRGRAKGGQRPPPTRILIRQVERRTVGRDLELKDKPPPPPCRRLNCCCPSSSLPPSSPASLVPGCSTLLHKPWPTDAAPGGFLAIGFHLGGLVHIIAAAFGMAVLLRTVPALYVIVKLLGAIYLVWLGIGYFIGSNETSSAASAAGRKSSRKALRDSIMVEVLNPKTAWSVLIR